MKMLTNIPTAVKILSVLLLVFASTLSAQNKEYKNEPGYIDFGDLSSLETDGEKVTEVTLDEQLLKLAAGFSKDDKKVNALMSGLKFIKVNSFEVSKSNKDKILNKIKSVDNELTGRKWNRIVKSRSSDENSNVYIKTDSNGQVVGLVVTNFEKNGEAAFINIVGTIDMDAMSSLSEKFDIPSLNHVKSRKR